MELFDEIRLPLEHPPGAIRAWLDRRGVPAGRDYVIVRKSLDARRRRGRPCWVYRVGVPTAEERVPAAADAPPVSLRCDPPPVVVGTGPGGLFAAWWLTAMGQRPVVLERGPPLAPRMRAIARFMRRGELDPRANLCFGAGGAGTFSDGKLFTRGRSPHAPAVLDTFVALGAPAEIRSLADAHLGSNRIRRLIGRMLDALAARGAQLRFSTALAGLEVQDGAVTAALLEDGTRLPTDAVLLAPGHSARELYPMLAAAGVRLSFQPFAVGLRMEHPAALIDRAQYGEWCGHPALGAASYRLVRTWKEPRHRTVYTFCMCPGGYLLNTATEPGGVVTNGMANYEQRSGFSNAGVVVNVAADEVPGDDPLRGVAYQRALERRAADFGNPPGGSHVLPASRLVDFLDGRTSALLPRSSSAHPLAAAPLHELFAPAVTEALRRGLADFDRRLRGLIDPRALLVAVESRTSSPVRIERDPDTRESVSVRGLYPIGEGAGYAGGIMSAACDGVASARAWAARALAVAESSETPTPEISG